VFTKDLIEHPVSGQKVVVPDGDSTNNWLYVKDAANAVLLACYAENVKTRLLNIAGEAATIRDAAGYVRKVLPGARIELLLGEEQPGAKMLFDISRAQREIGYKPSYSLEKGITEYIQKTRNNRSG
jgi:UDP-glucose 4-epimerase